MTASSMLESEHARACSSATAARVHIAVARSQLIDHVTPRSSPSDAPVVSNMRTHAVDIAAQSPQAARRLSLIHI